MKTQQYDKELQDVAEEVNSKRSLGYKLLGDLDQPNKLKVLYQHSVHLLEDEIPKELQPQRFACHLHKRFCLGTSERNKGAQSEFGLLLSWIYKQQHANKEERRAKQRNSSKIDFESKLWLERAQLEQRKPKLEMQMKALETKRKLLQEKRELEHKVKRTASEKSVVRSTQPALETNNPSISPQLRCSKTRASKDYLKFTFSNTAVFSI